MRTATSTGKTSIFEALGVRLSNMAQHCWPRKLSVMSLYSVEIGIYRLSDATVLLAFQALQSNVYDRVTKGFASNSLFMTAGRQVQHAKLLEAQFPADEVLDLFYNFPIEDIEQTPWKAVCPLPQLFDFLRKEWGVKIGILTLDSRKNAKSFLQSQGVQVDAMVCANEGFADKPDPAGLASILKELGVAKEKAVMVGDVRIDMAVGVNAGCVARVGVLSGMDDEKALREAGATIVLPDVSHLIGDKWASSKLQEIPTATGIFETRQN